MYAVVKVLITAPYQTVITEEKNGISVTEAICNA